MPFFDDALILAPMAGFTDAALRQIISKQGADLCYTEMVSAKGLLYENRLNRTARDCLRAHNRGDGDFNQKGSGQRTTSLLMIPPAQKIKAVQLFGAEPDIFAAVLTDNPVLADFEIVDINMGCPVRKVVKSGEGSALMKDLKRAGAIVAACRKAAPNKTITAKIRAGWDANNINAVEAAKALEDSGIHAITIHSRTREQFYSGECDYELVARVRNSVKVPVIVSGGIVCENSYKRIREITGCSSVMIGRGALGTELFACLRADKMTNDEQRMTDKGQDLFLTHLRLMREYYGEHYALTNIRKFTPYYFKNLSGARQLRAQINTAKTTAEIENIMREL